MIAGILHNIASGFNQLIGLLTTTGAEVRAPIAISLGAIPGALSRYYLTLWCSQWFGTSFPFGTFLINLTGAMVMGFFVTLTLERSITTPELRLLIATGFLGSYTTFSTYALDTVILLQTGSYGRSLVYWLGSAVLGVLGLQLGSFLARSWRF